MKKLLYIAIFLFFTPITLFISIIAFSKSMQASNVSTLINDEHGTVLAAAQNENYTFLSQPVGTIDYSISTSDARPILIKNYLEKYHSPLLPYSDYIFQVSEKYGLDYGLIVAIAQCESNVCKKIPEGSYNCWGWGNGEAKFSSWERAIEIVAQTLKEDYIDKGLTTPDEIMPKYVPPSVEKGGPWAKCVNQFLDELR